MLGRATVEQRRTNLFQAMRGQEKPASRTRTLLGLSLLVAALLFVLALIEGPDAKLGCTPIGPAVAQDAPPAVLEPAPIVLDAPPPRDDAKVQVSLTSLKGRVTDRTTNEPVPWVDLEIQWTGGSSRSRTGKDGSFSISEETHADRFTAIVSDDGEEIGRFDSTLVQATRPEGWQIAVRIGPTIPIHAIDGQPCVADAKWRVRLRESRFPFGSAGEIKVRGDELSVPAEMDERDWGWRAVRFDGDVPFVRWPKRKFQNERTWYPIASLRSDVRFAKAQTGVSSNVGIQPALEIATTAYAIVTGRVTVQGESAKWNSAKLLVFEPGAHDEKEPTSVPWFASAVPKDAQYSIETPSNKTLRFLAWAPHHVTAAGQALVQTGQEHGPDFTLFTTFATPSDYACEVAPGFERDGEGFQLLRLRLHDAPLSEAWLYRLQPPGVIDTSRLPTDGFDVENIGVDEAPVITARIVDQHLPARSIDSMQRLGLPAKPHRVELAGLPSNTRFEVTIGPGGSLFTSQKERAEQAWSFAPTNPASFVVWTPGFAPTAVEEREFLPRDTEVVAEVRPKRGWGVNLVFRADDARTLAVPDIDQPRSGMAAFKQLLEGLAMPPLPGVRVTLKGVPLGVSAADGSVLAAYTVPPEQLSLVAPGWHLSALHRMPGAGSRWWVWMKRDE
jgi:hypothetical protein